MIESPSISERLLQHGIGVLEYTPIKQIASFVLASHTIKYSLEFGNHSFNQSFKQLQLWRKCLENDFFLKEPLRGQLLGHINGLEFIAILAFFEANADESNTWRIECHPIAIAENMHGNKTYGHSFTIKAINKKSNECRTCDVIIKNMRDYRITTIQNAFERLGIWGELDKGKIRGIADRKPYAWPICTKFVIPKLYEYMVSFYPSKGKFSDKRDSLKVSRSAIYNRELFKDMIDVLVREQPVIFTGLTVHKLNANIQRYQDDLLKISKRNNPKKTAK